MKLYELIEAAIEPTAPKIDWSFDGKRHVVRIEYTPSMVYIHKNEDKEQLEQLVAAKYKPRKFLKIG
jgi:DNA-binding protein YbaB